MNLQEARKRLPELEGLSDSDAIDVIQQVYYPQIERTKLEKALGYTAPPPPTPERSTLRAAGDLGLQFAGGAVSGVRMMTDLLGANNAASGGLRSAEDALQALQSATAKADQQQIAAIMKEAEGKGFADQVIAGVRAFGTAPAAMVAQAIGTSLPTLATALIPGAGAGAVAARLGMAGLIGAGQGAGAVKGAIYDEVKSAPLPGETPEQTEARAMQAQAYTGPNADQIALGGGLGVLAGSTGIERAAGALRNGVTKAAPGMLGRVGMGALTESAPEALQGGQEKFATNTALAREGMDVDPWAGVVAGGTMEALAGGLTGGIFGIPNPGVQEQRNPVKEAGDAVRAAKVPESGPMTKAVNAGTEMVAKQAEADVAAQVAATTPASPMLPMPTTLTGTDAATLMQPPENPLLGAAQEMQADRQSQARTDAALAAMERQAARDQGALRDFGGGSTFDDLPAQANDVLNPSGQPFKTKMAAERAAKKTPGDVVAVPGGFVVRPKAQESALDAPQATPDAAAGPQADPAAAPAVGGIAPGVPADPAAGEGGTAPAVRGGQPEPQGALKLPRDLAGAKPRYSYGPKAFNLEFESDVDRAAYVIAQANTSSRDADYLKFVMDATGMDETAARAYGGQVKDAIKARAKDADAGTLPLPDQRGGIRNMQTANAPAQPTQGQSGEWQTFPPETGSLNLPRAEMPQVKSEHRGPMVNFLNARGIEHEADEVDPAELKPTQAEYSLEKVKRAQEFGGTDRSILISSDGYVVDGHHQWLAKGNKGEPVKVIRLKAPIKDLLPLVREFPSSTVDTATADVQKQAPAAPAQPEEAKAARVEAPAPAGGDGAAEAGVSDARGTGDAQADGVTDPADAKDMADHEAARQRFNDRAPRIKAARERGDTAEVERLNEESRKDDAIMRTAMAKVSKRSIERASSERVSKETQRFAGLPVGARMRPSEFPNGNIFWEKVGQDEWRGTGAMLEGKTSTSQGLAERGGLVEIKASQVEVSETKAQTTKEEGNTAREKALQRIAKGTAYFGTTEKAQAFIDKFGLGDTHEAVQTKPGRFEVQAKKAEQKPAAPAPAAEAPWSDDEDKRLLAIIGRNGGVYTRDMGGHFSAEVAISNNDTKGVRASGKTPLSAKRALLKKLTDEAATPEQASNVEFIKALEEARKELPDGFTLQAERDSVALKEGGRYAVTGLGRNAAGVAEALRQAKLRAQANAATAASAEPAGPYARWRDAKISERQQMLRAAGYTDTDQNRVLSGTDWSQLTDPVRRALSAAPAAAPAPEPAPAVSANTIFTEDAAAKARALLKKKLSGSTLNSGIDPELLQAGITLAGYHIERGARTFAAYASAMLADLGEGVKPYLKSWYMGVKYDPRAAALDGMDSAAVVEAADVDNMAAPADTQEQQQGDEDAARTLDGAGPGALEGAPAQDVQGTAGQRPTGDAPARSGRGDQPADAGTDGAGVSAPRSVGGDTRAVPVPARGTRDQRGSTGEPGVSGDARAQRRDEVPGDDGRGNRGGQDGRVTQQEPGRVEPPAFKPTDFTIEEDFALGEGGQKTKYRNNIEAIRLLKALDAEQRHATPDEQAVLAKYVGWGGISQAFDGDKEDWAREFKEVRELLSDEEYETARRSTRYAHYTSRQIIEGMYAAMKRMGFTGGKILEPGAGVGNFMGLMPADLRTGSRMTGVERERIAAGIARHLYPNQNMQLQDFTQFQALDGYFDAVIGNPPFAPDGLTDKSGRKHLSGMAVHDYFFAKSIDLLRDGGVFAAVVSNGFMDKAGDRARRYIGERARLLGAIRLPNNAFAKNANTEVTTDIVFLQKLPESQWGSKDAKADLKRWMDQATIPDPKGGEPIKVNRYFADNPEMMLGEYGRFGTMYGPDQPALVARPGQDTGALLLRAIERLPKDIYEDAAVVGTAKASNDIIEALRDPSVQEGGFYVDEGKLYQRMPDRAGETSARLLTPETKWTEKTTLGESRYDRLVQLAGLRRTMRDLLAAELADDKGMEALRQRLNEQYDAYTAKHGLINDASTAQVFDDDPDFPLLSALELNYVRGIGPAAAKSAGIKPFKSKADKAPIFERRVIERRQAVQKAQTPEDALNVSLAERGRIDPGYIGKLLGRPADEVLEELTKGEKPALFVDPVTGEHVLRDAYLSGNVRKKLEQAKMAGADRNVRALMAVQPEDVGAHEISARLGAPWIPTEVYADFIKGLLGEGTKANVSYVSANSSFSISVKPGSDVANTVTFGTSRMSAEEILHAMLNNRSIKVMDRNPNEMPTLNKDATDAANEKAADIKAKFQDWVFADPERSEVLVRAYNDTNNNYVTRVYDGSRMQFPGKVPDGIIKFRRHQRNAIARIVQDRTALLDHVVGAGKTYTVVAGAMELKRTGLAKKPMIAVPNHLVKQWAADFYRLYPGANILTATKKDFERENRRRFLAKIATGDWDAVIIAHSSFGFIKPDPDFEADFNAKQIAHIKAAIEQVDAGDADGKSKKRTVKQLEAMVERLENRIAALRDKPVDNLLDFKQIGVDQLFVDEFHLFKNLMFSTKMQNVQGLGDSKGSQRAYDMLVKISQIYAQNGREQGFVAATGTPVSNTLAEMYHMMRYLMPGAIKEQGFESFDAWANTFASVEQVWMQKPSGDGYKASDRMSSFNNAPELLKMFDQVSDTVTMDDIKKAYAEENDGEEFPLPKLKGDKRTPVSLVKSEGQAAYMEEIAKRAEELEKRKGPPQKGEDNFLTIMSDARKAAMDVRLVDFDRTEREKGGRIDRASDEVVSRYRQYDAVKGTQLVFSDLGTPLSGAKKEMKEYEALRERIDAGQDAEVQADAALGDEAALKKIEDAEAAQEELDAKGADWLDAIKAALRGFSVYDDFKKALIEKGIPENEIAFIHDYNTDEQKAGLFRKVKAGQIRVLMGSTPKLGAGTNVQDRLVALHHLDVPWKPSDVEQREGRIIRQGNLFATVPTEKKPNPHYIPGFEVEILAYVTQDTLDMRMWQTQEVKLKMINQLRTRQVSRDMENPFEQAEMSAGEMQAAATGNMDLLREIQLRADVKKLEQRKRSFDAQRNDLANRRRRAQQNIGRLPNQIAEMEALAGPAMEYFRSLENRPFSATINGETVTSRTDAEDRLRALVREHEAALDAHKAAADAAGEEAGAKFPEGSGERAGAVLDARDAYLKANAKPKMAVEFNGKTYGSKSALGDAMVDAAGDREPIAWEFGGETYIRRRQIASAIEEAVVDAGATDTVREVGKIGAFTITVEGQRDKYGARYFDVVAEVNGRRADSTHTPAEKADGRTQAEGVIRTVERLLANLPSNLDWAKGDLRSAQKALAELDKTSMPDVWPDQAKLDKARADHKEVLNRLAGKKEEGAAPTPDAADVRFSRGAGQGITKKAATEVVDAIRRRWANGPEVVVVATMQDPAVPRAVREADIQQRSQGATGEPEGFWYGGKAYVVAGALNGPADVVRVLFHETLGHYGLRGVFGEGLTPILKQLAALRRKEVQAKARQYGLDMTNEQQRLQAAEEVLAEMAQTRPEIGFVQRAIAAVRAWLRKNVPMFKDMELTDAEIIQQYILPARRFVEQGARAQAQGQAAVAFSQGDSNALAELARADDLFAVPKSDKTSFEDILAELVPGAHVKKITNIPGRVQFNVTLPDQSTARVMQRPHNPYGETVYGFDLDENGEMMNMQVGRPGENPEDVGAVDDVWIDVSLLKPGSKFGEIVYSAAANYAHNTGRIFIGDPAGLSDEALRRRTEQMISSALKFGTTEHLAPHPRQTAGSEKLGVPALKWVYGDHVGNIERMIDVSLQSLKNAGFNVGAFTYDPAIGQFVGQAERKPVPRGLLAQRVAGARAVPGRALGKGEAGWRTVARAALFGYLKSTISVESGSQQRGGLLDRLRDVSAGLGREPSAGGDYPASQRIFYSRSAKGLTDTPEFRRWFGDSKVVDEDGKPLVVYHGTKAEVSVFNPDLTADGGFHFGTAAQANMRASGEGKNMIPAYLKAENLQRSKDLGGKWKAKIAAAKSAGKDGIVYLNRYEGMGSDVIVRLRNEGLLDKLDRMSDAEFRRAVPEARDSYIVFRPEQIKSAVGNSGAFDPGNPDIRFSRAQPGSPDDTRAKLLDTIPAGVLQRLEDLTTSQRGFNRWWHRTVGTQLHKAKTNKEFGRVFYAVQDFMKDTSRMATIAADHAPDLLPQVDSLKDVQKLLPQMVNTKARRADLKAASDALFDGTLRYTRNEAGQAVEVEPDSEEPGGLVWTDAELRARGMNEKAIALYRQAREAINQSMDNLLAADVYRMMTAMKPEMLADDPGALASLMDKVRRTAASDEPRKAVSLALRALDAQGAQTLAQIRRLRAQVDSEKGDRTPTAFLATNALKRATDLMNQIEQARETMQAKIDRVAELQARGYAPLMRFGPYTVDVVDPDGTRVFFGMYETQFAANRAARRFREQGLVVSQGVKSQREFELLKGVSPETAMLFADMLGIEKNDVMQAWLQNALAEQSALKRHIRRKGIDGFDDDASRVVAAFLTSNSRAGARALHGLRIQEFVENVREGDVKDEAIALAQYVDNPREEAQAVRSLLFVNYIGGSIASALVNLTQTLVQTFPYLAQFGGATGAARRLAAAMKLALGKIEDPDLAEAVQRAERDGVIKPQEVFQLQAEASRSLGSDLRVRAGLALWGSFFQAAEVFNRRVAFIAAYQTAKERKIPSPFAFAENAVDETQGVFNKGNRPNWARGAVGATLFTFKTFTIQYVEFLKRLPPKEKALALAVLVVLSGFRGIPFAEDAEDIIDTVAQHLGYSFTTKDAMHRFAANTLGKDFADFLMSGASGTGLLPFDVSARLGMGDLLPATGLLKPSETRREDQVLEAFGVAGGFVRDATKKTWTPSSVAELADTAWAPVAIRNLAKGIEMYDRGIYTDGRGRKVMDVTAGDAALKAIGLQPAKVASESRAVSTQYEQRALFTKVKGEISEQIALGMFEGDQDKVRRARERMTDWNEKNPDAKIVLSGQGIRRRVAEMRKDRTERFVSTAPRELRQQTREALGD